MKSVMKRFRYFFLALAAISLAAVSCQEKETPFQPGEPEESGCYGVYFPTQDATGYHVYDPTMPTVATFTAARTNASGAIDVPLVVSDPNNVYQVGTLHFNDGQSEAQVDVNFPGAEAGVTYPLSLTIEDSQYASKYSSNPISIDFSVMRVEMLTFKNPKTGEDAVFTLNEGWWNEVHYATMQYYEVDGVRTCTFNSIEDGGIWGDSVNATLQFRWYTKQNNEAGKNFLEVPKQYFGFDYSDWESKPEGQAVNPIYVYDYYWYWIERGYTPDQLDGGWLGFAATEGQSDGSGGYPVGYYDGNGGFYFNLRYYIPGLGGFSPPTYDFVAIAPGYTRVDYSLEIEADYSSDGVTPLYVEAGADIASISYAAYEGELTATQVANKVAAIASGADPSESFSDFEFDEDEAINYATVGVVLEKTGIYTLVVVAKDAEGNAQNSASIVINYVAAGDVEEHAVKINVFTEPVPARYGASYTEYDSFAYGILGSNITEAHVAIVKASDLSSSTLASLKTKGTPVSDNVLSAINGEGGYYTVQGGLNPGVVYAVVVWATNGDMDDFAYATWKTTPSPEVWEPVGSATWTDAFFGPWFSADPLTYDVALEASQDVPGRYRLVNVYGEAFGYNEPGDWDDSEDYYFVLNADDPEKVWFETFDTGCNWGYGDFLLTCEPGLYVSRGEDIAELKADPDILFGVLEDNVVTFPAGSVFKAMAGYNNGAWYYGNKDVEWTIVLNFEEPAGVAPAHKSISKTRHGEGVFAHESLSEPNVFERNPQPVKASFSYYYDRMVKNNARTMSPVVSDVR